MLLYLTMNNIYSIIRVELDGGKKPLKALPLSGCSTFLLDNGKTLITESQENSRLSRIVERDAFNSTAETFAV